jgi:hypothetical protein
MKLNHGASGIAAALAFGVWSLMTAANAAPPTVTPSPRYDARLQEQRAAQGNYASPYERVMPRPTPARRHHVKRLHHSAR